MELLVSFRPPFETNNKENAIVFNLLSYNNVEKSKIKA